METELREECCSEDVEEAAVERVLHREALLLPPTCEKAGALHCEEGRPYPLVQMQPEMYGPIEHRHHQQQQRQQQKPPREVEQPQALPPLSLDSLS
jgi:hypothetical protein